MSACQLAGFRHVIGTLWEVNDESCVDMAKLTYRRIMEDGMTDDAVCRGLHNASKSLRDRWLESSQSISKSNLVLSRSSTEIERRSETGISPLGIFGYMRSRRDISLLDDDHWNGKQEEATQLYWVPYVHYGV
jgi:CHAT domain-containing protein